MPSTFAMLDQSLPRFTGEEALEEKVAQMEDYQVQLLEQIRWALGHLDLRNMNKGKMNQWVGTITEPIRAKLEDQEGNLTQLAVTAKGLQAQIKDNAGNITSLQATAQGLSAQISSAKGDITSLQATAQGLASRVQDAEKNISTVTQTATGLQSQVSALDGRVSTVTQTAAGLQSTVSNQAGQISSIRQTVNGIQTTVGDLDGDFTSLVQDLNGFKFFNPKKGTTLIDGGAIKADTIKVNSLYGATVRLMLGSVQVGSLDIADTSTGFGLGLSTVRGGIQLEAGRGNIYLAASTGQFLQLGQEGLCQIGGGPFVVGKECYNTRLPSAGTYGQVFFLLE